MVGLGIAVLVIGLTIRIIVSYFSVLGGDLNLKERLFVTLGKKHALKIFDQFALNTSCFWRNNESNVITRIMQFQEIFVTNE